MSSIIFMRMIVAVQSRDKNRSHRISVICKNPGMRNLEDYEYSAQMKLPFRKL